jgi:2-methylisocitrate lyase-like PEP mutase family enzyme
LAQAIDGPLNILAGPGSPGTVELERLGVARVTLGSGPMRATAALTARIATELFREGAYLELEGAMPYAELNALLA